MTDRLGHKQTATLLTLMAMAREVSNPELRDLAGFVLDGKYRRELNSLGLVDSRKDGRRYVHELTEAGWAWCADELKAGTPPPPHGTLSASLYVILAGLDRYLSTNRLRPADLFATRTQPAGADLESRIRAAYRALATTPGEWVALASLRPEVGASAPEVDKALKQLSMAGVVRLVPRSNRKLLTAADHAAAIRIGGEDNHQIAIETS